MKSYDNRITKLEKAIDELRHPNEERFILVNKTKGETPEGKYRKSKVDWEGK